MFTVVFLVSSGLLLIVILPYAKPCQLLDRDSDCITAVIRRYVAETLYCIVLLRSSRSISRSQSSTAIEWDRNRDLSCSIFADYCWAMASTWIDVITKVITRNTSGALDFVGSGDWSATQWNDVGRRSIHANLPSPTASRMPNRSDRVPLKRPRRHRPRELGTKRTPN